ncbi:MAG: WD40 repeat domain-containing protein, partial [Phormidesmis sp.]
GHSAAVYVVRFSPTTNTTATASRDGTAKLWHNDGSLVATLGHSNDVEDVRFSPDGNTIATASRDGTAKLWSKDSSLNWRELHPCLQLKGYLQSSPLVEQEEEHLCD